MKYKLLLVLPILAASSGFIFSQTTSVLRIIVLEKGQQPITGATVLLYEEGSEDFSDYCISTIDGFCEFRSLADSLYTIRISFIGFKAHSEDIKIGLGQTKVETIILMESTSELDEILIVGDRQITTGEVGITRITSEDLSRIPSMNIEGDLMAYIQTVSGVVTVGDQGGDLYIRGGTPAQNQVLIDNIPIVKPFHILNLFSALPEQAVSNIEIFAGGFDNQYMGSTSAVIDATLKTGDFTKYSSSVSFSPYISSLFFEGPTRKDERSLMFSGRVSTIDKYSGYLGTKEQDLRFNDFITRYSIQGNGFNCNFTGILTNDRGRINERRENYLEWSNTGLGARCFGYDERFEHPYEISIGFSRYVNSEGDGNITEREAKVTQSYMRFDLQEYLYGLKIDYGFNIIAQGSAVKIDEKFTLLNQFNKITPNLQLYAKTELNPFENIQIQPGLSSQLTPSHPPTFEPRVRFMFKPLKNERFEVSLATGLYNQLMDGITDERDAGTTFTAYRPNDRGEPLPSAFHAILGVRNRIGKNWKTNVESYYKSHRNIPVSKWQPLAKLETETTLAKSNNYGFDINIEYSGNQLYLYAGYGWSKSEYSAESEDLGAWVGEQIFKYYPPHDQRHKLNTILSLRTGKIETSLNWEFGSGMPYTQILGFDLFLVIPREDPTKFAGQARTLFSRPYSERLPVYHRLDASVKRSFTLSNRLEMTTEIGCINIYDRRNVFYLDLNLLERVDQAPILPYAGIKLALQ